jgi:hypothetical protein
LERMGYGCQPTGLIQMCLILSWIILKVFCCGICAVDGLLVCDLICVEGFRVSYFSRIDADIC